MNARHAAVGWLVWLVIAGCDGPRTRDIEGVPPEPAAPQATRKLPDGRMFLRKGLSITHADGVRRIVPGTMVTVVSEGSGMIVAKTEDGTQLEAPITSFGNDLDELDAIHATKTANAKIMAEKAATARVLEEQRQKQTEEISREYAARLKSERIAKLRNQAAALKSRIDAAEREIEEKMRRGYYVRDHWNGYRWVYRTLRVGATLGADASQIDKLWSTYNALQNQIRTMEAE